MKSAVKTIGAGGQIYLGKEFAGQHVVIRQQSKGVWVIKTAEVVPHDEQWLNTPENRASMARAVQDAGSRPARVTTDEEAEALFARALALAERRERVKKK
jgi:hypothetical protein